MPLPTSATTSAILKCFLGTRGPPILLINLKMQVLLYPFYGNSNTETRERQTPPAKFKVALTVRFQPYTGIALRARTSLNMTL